MIPEQAGISTIPPRMSWTDIDQCVSWDILPSQKNMKHKMSNQIAISSWLGYPYRHQ